ncbi:MAG: SDR family oxidoreductase [Acidimicrobiia bacterium]|nr:SDR family oxidoreductase [Acidimicrobiia bacterium]MBV9043189.1 SDR family oxidoreductase [Acidimicrobiia bacterium]
MTAAPAAIVTGANSGIGLETARGLARAGYRTGLLCRNQERAEIARADIAASVPDAQLETLLCDLGLQADVRRAAADIDARFDRLDVLVNNAGVELQRREETAEGIETMLAVNHLGPFLLTNLLLPLLRRSAPSRVVVVASEAHKFRRLRLDDIQAERRGYGLLGFPRYGETKLMNILFTKELARRLEGSGVTANCLHPGSIRSGLGSPPRFIRPLVGLFLRSPEAGARTSLTVATDPALDDVSGVYFMRSKPADKRLSRQARDDDLARALWAQSEALVGLT